MPREPASPKGADAQGLGRSRGGLKTRIHAANYALGLPVRLIGTPRQRHDIALAQDSIEGFEADAVIADKGCNADCLADAIVESGAEVVIPPRHNRKLQNSYARHLYRERNAVERFFCTPKQFRRAAARYDKLLVDFKGVVELDAIAIWLEWSPRPKWF